MRLKSKGFVKTCPNCGNTNWLRHIPPIDGKKGFTCTTCNTHYESSLDMTCKPDVLEPKWIDATKHSPPTYHAHDRERPCLVKLICKSNGLLYDVVPAHFVTSRNHTHWVYLE